MFHFKSFNISKLFFDNLKLPKNRKIKISHQFKSEMTKEFFCNILVIDFFKMKKYFKTYKNKKLNERIGTDEISIFLLF